MLKYLPGDFFCVKRTLNNVAFVEDDFIYPQLDNHIKRYSDSTGEAASDFVEAYLREMNKMKDKETTLDSKRVLLPDRMSPVRLPNVERKVQDKCFQETAKSLEEDILTDKRKDTWTDNTDA